MYGQELGSMVESVIQKLEDKAYQPPRICWNGGARSSREMLDSQSSGQEAEQDSTDVMLPNLLEDNLNLRSVLENIHMAMGL